MSKAENNEDSKMKKCVVKHKCKLHHGKLYRLIIRYFRFKMSLSPQQNLLLGFLTYTILGWLLLSLFFFHKQPVSMLDSLFIATSAISTTGLVTVSVFDTYNWFGQLIIMSLFQLGGVGYMTFTSFILLSNKSKLSNWRQKVLNAEFAMPRGFEIKVIFTIMIETIGAFILYKAFVNAGVEHNFAIWSGIYHSISAFCTAGFGLYNDSFEQFANIKSINLILSSLSICGSLGFIVVTDFWNRLTRKSKEITYTTKTIFGVMLLLLISGTLILYFCEPSIRDVEDRLMAAFFQTMTALTTVGFNTVPIGSFSTGILMVIIFLMNVGASPSGTGGGMKSTTFTAIIAIIWNRLRNNLRVTFFGKTIPIERLYVATSVFILYSSVIFFSSLFLSVTENFPLDQILFEVSSALGTVGLSTGITGGLSSIGKLIVIFVMFIGRLGILTFGLAILAKREEVKTFSEEADLVF